MARILRYTLHLRLPGVDCAPRDDLHFPDPRFLAPDPRDRRERVWYAEHQPYGEVHVMRAGAQRHQPLRFPGQEAEQLGAGVGPNGVSSRSYNIFRWYRAGAGRYTQADPIGLRGGMNIYGYGAMNPLVYFDPLGLQLADVPTQTPPDEWGILPPDCTPGEWKFEGYGPLTVQHRQLFELKYSKPIAVATVPSGAGGAMKTTWCNCYYEYSGTQGIFERDSLWIREINCEGCGDGPAYTQTGFVSESWKSPVEVPLPSPLPTRVEKGLYNPNFNHCNCPSPELVQ